MIRSPLEIPTSLLGTSPNNDATDPPGRHQVQVGPCGHTSGHAAPQDGFGPRGRDRPVGKSTAGNYSSLKKLTWLAGRDPHNSIGNSTFEKIVDFFLLTYSFSFFSPTKRHDLPVNPKKKNQKIRNHKNCQNDFGVSIISEHFPGWKASLKSSWFLRIKVL